MGHALRAMSSLAVLAVVYLIFNEGYGGRAELSLEAIRLGRALAELMPDEAEAFGLLALMLINNARHQARFVGGELVLLRDQDRALWDRNQIDAGKAALDRAVALGGRGSYVLQAAIAALHADEPKTGHSLPRSMASSRGAPDRQSSSSMRPLQSPRRATLKAGSPLSKVSIWTSITTCTPPEPEWNEECG